MAKRKSIFGRNTSDSKRMKVNRVTETAEHREICNQFSCDICHGSFKTKDNIRKHMKTHSQPVDYQEIKNNVCSSSIQRKLNVNEMDVCNCEPQSMCISSCLNRSMSYECDPDKCLCKNMCTNVQIQKLASLQLERFTTEGKGVGVRTKDLVKKGVCIVEYVGEVITKEEYLRRLSTIYKGSPHFYGMHLHGKYVIDSHRMGNISRFINSSCDPNCEIQRWFVKGEPRIAIFAKKNINVGEELTIKYNASTKHECLCGARECTGYI